MSEARNLRTKEIYRLMTIVISAIVVATAGFVSSDRSQPREVTKLDSSTLEIKTHGAVIGSENLSLLNN